MTLSYYQLCFYFTVISAVYAAFEALQLTLCNQKTAYVCACTNCLSNFQFSSWLSIEFGGTCAISLDELQLRSKLALWINEECAIVLRCGKLGQGDNPWLQSPNILIGSIGCTERNNSIVHLNVVYNSSARPQDSNSVDLAVVGAVVQSREHLLSSLLHSHIHSVQVTPTSSIQVLHPPSAAIIKLPAWHYLVYGLSSFLSSFLVSATLLFCLVVGYLNWGISWARFSKGKWIKATAKPQANPIILCNPICCFLYVFCGIEQVLNLN